MIKIVLLFFLWPVVVRAESASMTLSSLRSMQEAERARTMVCQRLRANRGNLSCLNDAPALRSAMQRKMISCHTEFNSADCSEFIRVNPQFRGKQMNCNNAYDVCRAELNSTFFQGCTAYGLQVKTELVDAFNSFQHCMRSPSCVSRHIAAGTRNVVLMLVNPAKYGRSAAESISNHLRDRFHSDYNRMRRLQCLNPDEAARITCELLDRYSSLLAVGYSGARVGIRAAAGSRAGLGDAGNIIYSGTRVEAVPSQRVIIPPKRPTEP